MQKLTSRLCVRWPARGRRPRRGVQRHDRVAPAAGRLPQPPPRHGPPAERRRVPAHPVRQLPGRARCRRRACSPPGGTRRAVPYLYSSDDLAALMAATAGLRFPLRQAAYRTLIALLAVSGLRISEAIRLDDADVDHAGNLLQVRDSKFGKSRLVPLHPTTVGALAGYQRSRDQWHPAPHDPALFISPAGTRLRYRNVLDTFTTLVAAAELPSRPGRCRPRIHDLRHSLAVTTLLAWYADGDDVQARLPLLSTFLGHADPASTYWYLSASPELMAAAGARLDGYLAGQS